MNKSQVIEALVAGAERRLLVKLHYQKPTDKTPSVRLVEPYGLQSSGNNLMLRCWQSYPDARSPCWRDFRVDQIPFAEVTDDAFSPRKEAKSTNGVAESLTSDAVPNEPPTQIQKYVKLIEEAMLDGQITQEELGECQAASEGLSLNQLRAAHGIVLKSLLETMLVDNEIDSDEATYVTQTRKFLKMLGWGV